MREASDRELFLRCCSGDEEAWRHLYGYVLSIARWPRWGLGEAAEDLAQTVLLSLMEKGLRMVRSADSFRGFVRRTTINRILDHYKSGEVRFRHWGRDPDADEGTAPDPMASYPDERPSPEVRVLIKQDLKRWGALLGSLPAYCTSVIQAYMEYRLGLLESYRDIARKVGRPVNTVSVQIKRCLEQFRLAAQKAGIFETRG